MNHLSPPPSGSRRHNEKGGALPQAQASTLPNSGKTVLVVQAAVATQTTAALHASNPLSNHSQTPFMGKE